MKAARVFVTTPYEIVEAVEMCCARCGFEGGHHSSECIEPTLQKIALELLGESPERLRAKENGELL